MESEKSCDCDFEKFELCNVCFDVEDVDEVDEVDEGPLGKAELLEELGKMSTDIYYEYGRDPDGEGRAARLAIAWAIAQAKKLEEEVTPSRY